MPITVCFSHCNGPIKTRVCSGISTKWLLIHCFHLEFRVLIFVEEWKPESPEKNPQSRDENQQTQPVCDVLGGERHLGWANNFPWPNADPKCLIRKKSTYFTIKNTIHNCRGCMGGYPQRIGWGCAACFLKPLLYWRSKSANFPTLLMTWRKNFDTLLRPLWLAQLP